MAIIALSIELVLGVTHPFRHFAMVDEANRVASYQLNRDSIRELRKDSVKPRSLFNDDTALVTPPPVSAINPKELDDTTTRVKSPKRGEAFLDDILSGKNTDSLYYDVANKKVYIYEQGDVNYQGKNLKADFMQIDMNTREIYAYGKQDSIDGELTVVKPEFVDGGTTYVMDTITYNLKSAKAKIRGVATQEGDGWLIGNHVKKMPDNAINIMGGKYTTCDCTDHPHFYLAMNKAKMIPGKKMITGATYLVIEDVPIIGIPGGFFPMTTGAKSGLLMPTYGEDRKGFFLRDMGYYFILSDHMDLTLTGGIYSLGSWDAKATSRYIKRYKYTGSLNLNYGSTIVGEKGDAQYSNQNNFKIMWSHSQDAKANPGSTFSASVNLTSSGYNKYSTTNLDEILQTNTNSSISYSKNWAGTPFSMSANFAVSQNSRDKTLAVTLPTIAFNVARFYPLKRKEALGETRWYEKISMSYSSKLTNSVTTTEDEIFSSSTLQNMKNGIEHKIPISASLKAFNYIDISPSANYSEKWYFRADNYEWNPQLNKVDTLAPEYGFYRLYNYNFSVSGSTTVYGTYQSKKPTKKVQAVRHTITPNFGFSYAPDFSDQKYGYYRTVQTDSLGSYKIYSPYSKNAYGVPSSGRALSMNFGIDQSLEMKVLSDRDTSGVKKVKIIDQLSLSGSYNFLADSMRFSLNTVRLNTTLFGNFGLNLSIGLDPYRVTPEGKRYDKLFFPGRLTSMSWAYGYTFKSRADKSQSAINDITSAIPSAYSNPFYDPYGQMDPTLRRQYMSQTYYDFSIPWNFGFNYSVSYGIRYVNNGTTGYEPNITQTVGFNGSVNLTPKMGVTFTGGYDIMARKLTTSQIAISRDLHCWQMSFTWVPYGYYKNWQFNIGVKAASLADLKYDKSESMFDNMY